MHYRKSPTHCHEPDTHKRRCGRAYRIKQRPLRPAATLLDFPSTRWNEIGALMVCM